MILLVQTVFREHISLVQMFTLIRAVEKKVTSIHLCTPVLVEVYMLLFFQAESTNSKQENFGTKLLQSSVPFLCALAIFEFVS